MQMSVTRWALVLLLVAGGCESGAATDAPCPSSCGESGGACVDDKCVCPAWSTSCSGNCVDLAVDPANCGACGLSCGDGFLCSEGKCSATCSLTLCPGNLCVDTKNNPARCGSCDKPCAAGETCKEGVCTSTPSPPPTTTETTPPPPPPPPCGGADLGYDRNNCGTCGHVCPPAASGCSAGVCVCPMPQVYCPGTNSCANLDTSESNCGACGNKCANFETCCAFTGTKCVNVNWSENHCGSCTNKCGTGKKCCHGGCIDNSKTCT